VNDPIITSLGPPSARSTGVAHIMACCSFPHAICFGGRQKSAARSRLARR
jgi:hypothetical protein